MTYHHHTDATLIHDRLGYFENSRVAPEIRETLFMIPLQELERRLQVKFFFELASRRFEADEIRIVDISERFRIRIRLEGHNKTSGAYIVLASAMFSPEQVAWLMQRWQELHMIKEARLDEASIAERRHEVLKQKGLDEACIEAKRTKVIQKAGLDDRSVRTAREVLRQRLRLERESVPPPASRPN